MPAGVKIGLALSALAAVGAGIAVASSVGGTTGRPRNARETAAFDGHTRAYVEAVGRCEVAADGLVLEIRELLFGTSRHARAFRGDAARARSVCRKAKDALGAIDTNYFDDPAGIAADGVRQINGGMVAFLSYLSRRGPTQLLDARSRLKNGQDAALRGMRAINRRRTEQHLETVGLP